jgi:hypothetical protein
MFVHCDTMASNRGLPARQALVLRQKWLSHANTLQRGRGELFLHDSQCRTQPDKKDLCSTIRRTMRSVYCKWVRFSILANKSPAALAKQSGTLLSRLYSHTLLVAFT